MQHRRVRVEADRLLAVRQGLFGFAQVQQRLTQVGLGRSERRIQLDGAAEMLERLVFRPRSRSAIPRLLWATTKSAAARGRGRDARRPRRSCPGLQGRTQVAQRLGIVGPDREGGPAATGGALEIAQRAIRLGEIRMIDVRVGLDRHRPADQLDRTRVIPCWWCSTPSRCKRLGVPLLTRQDPLIQLGRRSQLTRSMHLDCGCQHVLHGEESRSEWMGGPHFLRPIPLNLRQIADGRGASRW